MDNVLKRCGVKIAWDGIDAVLFKAIEVQVALAGVLIMQVGIVGDI